MKRIKLYLGKYKALILIALLQIVPLILNLFKWFKEHLWINIIVSVLMVFLIIIINEWLDSKKREQILKQIDKTNGNLGDLSANTFTFSSSTVNELVTVQSKQNSLEKRIADLEKKCME